MSIVPISVSAWATADLMLSGSVTSSATTCASPPCDSSSARNVFRRSMRRAASTTAAPAWLSVRANCAPRPLEAPVTKATRPERSML
jgi:hypothetical protein